MGKFRAILRENEVFSMFDVESARFEANGKLTISRRGSLSESFLRVNNGYLSDEALDSAGKTTGWLEEELKKEGVRISAVCSAWNGRRKKGSMSSQKTLKPGGEGKWRW